MPPVLDRFRRRRDWIPARTFAWLGLVLVLAFWVLDAVAHVIVYQHGTMLHSLFSPEPGVVALRIASTLGIITVLFATNALHKRTRTAENERRTAQENLRLMFERSPDAIVSMSPDGEIEYANRNTEDLFGISAEKLVGMRCRDLPSHQRCFCEECPLSDLAGGQETTTRMVHCDGNGGDERWIEQRLYPLTDEAGELVSVVEIVRDVTDEELGRRALARSHDELERRVEERTAELRRTAAALRESEERYRAMFEDNQAVMLLIDPESGIIADANEAAVLFYGYSHGELIGMPVGLLHTVGADELASKMRDVCNEEDGLCFFRQRTKSGELRDVEIYASALVVEGKTLLYNIVHDVTERRDAERAAEQAFQELEQIFQSGPDGMRIIDTEHNILKVNDTFERLAGIPEGEAVGRKCYEVFWGPQCHTPACPLNRIVAGELEVDYETEKTAADGTTTPCMVTARPHYSDRTLVGVVESFRDITERKMAEEMIRHMALHDQLTGLPNRTLMRDRLELAASHTERHGDGLAVLFMDIDDFKYINDTLGHAAGDSILRDFAQRIRQALRNEDTMARMGGDEFVILLPGVRDRAAVLRIVSKIRRMLEEPFAYDGRNFKVTTSIGVAVYSDADESPDALVERADHAMYAVKDALGGGFGFAEESGLVTELDQKM